MKCVAIAVVIALLAVAGCSPAGDPARALAAIGSETRSPPVAERAALEGAVAQWAQGRFMPGHPRWFVLRPGAPAVAAMKAVDTELGDGATRLTASGPDGATAALYGWQLKQGGGVVVAVSRGDPALVGLYSVTFRIG